MPDRRRSRRQYFSFLPLIVAWTSNCAQGAQIFDGGDGTTTLPSVTVVEYTPFTNISQHVTVGDAAKILASNLNSLARVAHAAAAQEGVGDHLIIFPEDSLYGPGFGSRSAIRPYLEMVPDVGSPASEQGAAAGPVLRGLAGIARGTGAYVVASLGELVPCAPGAKMPGIDGLCPDDGAFQFNAAVGVDPRGVLVAKYRKVHTYFEPQFNNGSLPQVTARFTAGKLGTVAVAICNDATFQDTSAFASSSRSGGVDIVALPSWWVNNPPVLDAYAMGAAWSWLWGVSLAVSGSGAGWYTRGTGIYDRGDPAVTVPPSGELGVPGQGVFATGALDAKREWRGLASGLGVASGGSPGAPSAALALIPEWLRARASAGRGASGIGPGVSLARFPEFVAGQEAVQVVEVGRGGFRCAGRVIYGSGAAISNHDDDDVGEYWLIAMSGDVHASYRIFSQWPVQLCSVISCKKGSSEAACLANAWLSAGPPVVAASAEADDFDPAAYMPWPMSIGNRGEAVSFTRDCDVAVSRNGSTRGATLSCAYPPETAAGILSVGILGISRDPRNEIEIK